MPQEPESNNGGRNTAFIVLALVAVVGAAAVVFLVTRGDDSKSTESVSSESQQQVDDSLVASTTIPSDPSIPTISTVPVTLPATVVPTVAVPATTIPATTVTTVPVNLFTGTQAADVIAEVGVARGADPLRILSALFYPEYAFVQVQDPTIPVNVDEYQWRGTLASPAPVTLTGDGDLEANLYSDSEVNWAAIPGLVETALAQIPIEGAAVSHISVERNLPFTDAVQIRVFVSGTRSSGYLDADAQGTVINVSQG